MTTDQDPYQLSESKVQEPPHTLRGMFKHLGPGFILTASIVGSGELISTTVLGAEAGFVALWIILASCLVKVFVQLEFGRHAIYSGKTAFASFNELPGPRFGKGNWATWTWLALMFIKPLQLGGIIGGVAMVLHVIVPAVPIWLWVCLNALAVSLLVFQGRYSVIEHLSVWMIVAFTLFTFACVFALQFTEFAFSAGDLGRGLEFWKGIPPAVLGVAIAAFSITGVGGDEIVMYTYWLLEKGYAAKTGPRTDSPDWERRAKGWIRTMYWDAGISMVVYTVMTAAFYVLGAAVLHSQGLRPEGDEMVTTLSKMYTNSVGEWAEIVFLIGAFFVLFSTLFSALAGWSRLFTDVFGAVGWIDFSKPRARMRMIAILAWFFPAYWAVLFFFFRYVLQRDPVFMVLVGGAVTAGILLLVVVGAIDFHYRRTPAALAPGKLYTAGFWVSVVAIVALGVVAIVSSVEKFSSRRDSSKGALRERVMEREMRGKMAGESRSLKRMVDEWKSFH